MPETIGQRLKQAREARRLTLEKASEATRIRPHYLQALENDDYSVMISAAQGRGFLRLYADLLELNLDEIMAEVRAAEPVPAEPASPAPAADTAPSAESTVQPAPAPSPNAKPGRPGFWSRLLRRSAPAEPAAAETQPQAEPPAPVVEEPVVTEPVAAPEEPAEEPVKPARKARKPKSAAPASDEEKSKTTRRTTKSAAGKKKTNVEPALETPAPVEPAEEPPSAPIPAPQPEINIEEQTPPAALDEFHLQWWDRLRALVGIRSAEPGQPEAESEAGEGVAPEEVESEPEEEITPPAGDPSTRLSSNVLFAALGEEMRARRMALNLTREEIERHIRVRAHYLRALEDGNFDGLPSAVQTRGMLTNYATFLDLDVDAMLLRFADVLQARHRERHPLPPGARGRVQPSIPTSLPPLRGFVVADLLGIGLLVLLVAFTVWGINRVMQTRYEAAAEPTSPSISDVLLASTDLPTQPVTPTLGLLDLGNLTATPLLADEAEIVPTFPEGITVQINIVVLERTYMRVTVDGKVAFDGRVTPGTAYPFDGRERIELLTGNGAALRVTFNGRDVGFLGNVGQVVNVIYTAGGMITPTATIAPTATITRTPTITPSPTKTLVPSRTPTPQ